MTYDLVCEQCGQPYQATRRSSKTCSAQCRVARSKGKPPAGERSDVSELPISLVASTLTELAKSGRENTPAGQAALLLAYRLERSGEDNGSSVAALVKQHAATLAEALKAGPKASIVDDLKKRRDSKRAG